VRVEVCLRAIVGGDYERREISENESDDQEKREGGSWRHGVAVQGSYCMMYRSFKDLIKFEDCSRSICSLIVRARPKRYYQ
jgi:hypothetical protein